MDNAGTAHVSRVLGDVRFNQLYPKAAILKHLEQHDALLGGTIRLSEVWPAKPPVFWLDSDRDDAVFHPLQAQLFSVPDSYAEWVGWTPASIDQSNQRLEPQARVGVHGGAGTADSLRRFAERSRRHRVEGVGLSTENSPTPAHRTARDRPRLAPSAGAQAE